MTTVLLTGTYSSFNKGDLAMQLTAAQLLQARGAEVVGSVPFADIDAEVYGAAGVRVVASNRRKLIRASWQLLRLAVWRGLGRRPGWLVRDQNLEAFRVADLVIDLSGDMLTEDYGPHVAYSHFLPLLTAILLGRPLVILAQSIGPFRLTKPLARAILNQAALITVRDPVSQAYLGELDLEPPALTADLAFALVPTPPSETDHLWNALGLGDGQPVLGVSVSALTARHSDRRGTGTDFYAEMAAALDAFARTHDAAVVFFPHVTGPSKDKDDRVAAEKVRARMAEDSRAVNEDTSPAAMKALIGRSTWFLGCRMHANIAALSSRVPTAAIAYSHKTPGIMSRLGLDQYVLDVSAATRQELSALLDSVVTDSDTIAAHLHAALPEIEEAAVLNVDMALDQLAEKTP